MERFRWTSTCVLVVETGDLTRCWADAIVNTANEAHRAGEVSMVRSVVPRSPSFCPLAADEKYSVAVTVFPVVCYVGSVEGAFKLPKVR